MGQRRFLFYSGGAVLLLALLLVLHVGIGQVQLAPRAVVAALFNQPEQPFHRQIVWELRLPRGLIAAVTGAMLGLAGALLQVITRNPLAEPGLTGVAPGAVLLAVLWLVLGGDLAHASYTLPMVALVGGMAAGLLVYLLARGRQGRTESIRLTLIGVLLGALLSAVTSLFLLLGSGALGSILTWLIGSLNGRVWVHWQLLWPWALVALPLGLACAGLANSLQLGDEVAAGLGLRVEWTKAGLLGVAALLTAGAVAVVGAVGFIGLLGPHLARRAVGSDARRLFPFSMLLAALLLLGADVIAQGLTFHPPFETTSYRAGLPVGAVTALLGAPFFLWLLRRQSHTR